MVFSSVPVYLDPPNWNQQQQQQQYHHPPGGSSAGIIGSEIHQFTQGLTATPVLPEAASMATAGSVRPGSMSDRARLAKLPQPEQGLKCPRCDSTNTKFCYFNNYSLSQPRHFCKTCRRYWTRGGALRNVPVGGGCRRNKRSKSSGSSSKSAATASSAGGGTSSSSSTATGGGGGFGAITNSSITAPSQLSFMASLHHPLADHYGAASNLGLSFAGISPIDSLEYQMSGSNSGIGLEQWRQAQQFPFLGGLGLESQQQQPPPPLPTRQPASGLYSFETDGGGSNELVSQVLPKVSGAGLLTQQFTSSVKMEDANSQGLNLSRQYVGLHANDQYWGGGAGDGGPSSSTTGTGGWTGNLPNFNS